MTFTDIILSGNLGSIREMKKEIFEVDNTKHADRCLEKALWLQRCRDGSAGLGFGMQLSGLGMEDSERCAAAE